MKTIIFETSDAFSRRLIVTFIKPNSNFLLSKSSLQSASNSLLKRNDKFIVVSKSRAPDESVSIIKDFQLVVDSKSILNSEGARAVPITSYSVMTERSDIQMAMLLKQTALILVKVFVIESMRKMNSELITLATILFNNQTYL